MRNKFVVTGAVLCGLSVLLGAFWAHFLKDRLGADSISTFETGVRYQMYHGFALLISGVLFENVNKRIRWIFGLFAVGAVLFSGSIYLLSLDELLGYSLSYLGPLTPLGGLMLILGWVLLAVESISFQK